MYKQNRNSSFDLNYHLVLITKYRHPVIKGLVANSLEEYIYNYFSNNKVLIKEYNKNLDHIHILFEGKPNLNLANFVNGLKSNSSKFIRKKYVNELSSYYWKPYFWSNSYFIGCVNENSEDIIKEYIKNQKE